MLSNALWGSRASKVLWSPIAIFSQAVEWNCIRPTSTFWWLYMIIPWIICKKIEWQVNIIERPRTGVSVVFWGQALAWSALACTWMLATEIFRIGEVEEKITHIEVPHIAAGLPIMILSDTPEILSFFPYADASNKWSVVFSNDANIKTLSFILATPNRVIPRTSPYIFVDRRMRSVHADASNWCYLPYMS